MAAEAAGICNALERALESWELRRLLGGPYDARGAVLSIQVKEMLAEWRATLLKGGSLAQWAGPTAAVWLYAGAQAHRTSFRVNLRSA